jgi:hypothetical protein
MRKRTRPFRIKSSKRRIKDPDTDPDWTKNCITCGATPVVPMTEMCGPCTFGEASTAGGKW